MILTKKTINIICVSIAVLLLVGVVIDYKRPTPQEQTTNRIKEICCDPANKNQALLFVRLDPSDKYAPNCKDYLKQNPRVCQI